MYMMITLSFKLSLPSGSRPLILSSASCSSLCFLKDDLGTGGRGPPPVSILAELHLLSGAMPMQVPVQELGIGPPTIRVDSNITEDMDAFCEEADY